MNIRSLGNSGLTVTPLGLGLAALGRPGYLNLGHGPDLAGRRDAEALEQHTHAMLDAAWHSGIRYFDAARSYGRAEAFLASWLSSRAVDPATVTVGSKWGYRYTAGWHVDAEIHEIKDLSRSHLQSQYAESTGILGPYLKLYQIHSATREVLNDRAVLEALAEIRDSGVAIGLSVSGPQQGNAIRKAIEVIVDGVRLFGTVQATWNLLEPSAGPALREAHAAGLGVIVKEALANGRLTAREPAVAETLERWLPGTPPDAAALAAALAQPWTDVVLSGAATDEQLASNLDSTQVSDPGELPSIAEDPDFYWSNRSSLAWT